MTRQTSRRLNTIVVATFACTCLVGSTHGNAALPKEPDTVSPGRIDSFAGYSSTCPTFSWGGSPGSDSNELVVYELADSASGTEVEVPGHEARPIIHTEISGSATSWTPSTDQCLRPGGRYVWFLRGSNREGEGPWSSGRLFHIAESASILEVQEALKILERFLTEKRSEADARGEAVASSPEKSSPVAPRRGSPVETLADSAESAIRGELTASTGPAVGVVGVSHSDQGAGLLAENTSGGADLVLEGNEVSPSAWITEQGIDRPSPTDQTFDIYNSGEGQVVLRVDGEQLIKLSDINNQACPANQCVVGLNAQGVILCAQCDLCVDLDHDLFGLSCPVGADCDDTASSCADDCTDTDGDSRPDCQDLCEDADFDGYGTDRTADLVGSSTIAIGLCTTNGVTLCDSGSECLASDCYDANIDAHPGQTNYFTDHRGDFSFDYNCDGAETQRWLDQGLCPDAGWGIGCILVFTGWNGPIPECGESADWLVSCDSSCAYYYETRVQECR